MIMPVAPDTKHSTGKDRTPISPIWRSVRFQRRPRPWNGLARTEKRKQYQN